MNLAACLGLASARVIAICGAGGKSSLMFALAETFAAAGEDVLISTTTKLSIKQVHGRWPSSSALDVDVVRALERHIRGPLIAYHHADPLLGKAVGYSGETIDRIVKSSRFTRILIEADGAAGRPLKAPATHEPVFPRTVDAVVMVAGANGLGRPLTDETVFRSVLWSQRTGIAIGEAVAPDSLAEMVVNSEGLARGAPESARRVLFINQCDNAERFDFALRAVSRLQERSGELPYCAALGRLKPNVQIEYQACFGRNDPVSSIGDIHA